MPPRPHWKGYLKLSLVTCPVHMMPAVSESERVRFHTLNRETGNRVVSQYVDADSGDPVEDDDLAKGYEAEPDRFVIIEDEEIDAVALDTVRTIDIDKFVKRESIPWIYLDSPYFLTPADEVGEEAFSVIREAMSSARMVGISKLVLGRRERAVMLEPRERGILLWSLRFGDEVRDAKAYFERVDGERPDPEIMQLAKRFVESKTETWSPDMVKDPVQEHLLKLIASKRKRKGAKAGVKSQPRSGNVVNLFDQLKKSLAADRPS